MRSQLPMDLLDQSALHLQIPLSGLLRPKTLSHYIGQRHLINSPNGEIANFLRLGYLPSMILCGPPGVGKTSIARLLADQCNYVFAELSATDATVKDVRELSVSIKSENASRRRRGADRLRVVIFIDEIHRFTSVQQDFLLPFIESGDFVFIGATTVEPRKRIRGAILSRCQLFQLKALDDGDVHTVIRRAILFQNIKRKRHMQLKFLHYSETSMADITKYANGDMRTAINMIELMSSNFQSDEYSISTSATDSVSITSQDVRQLIESLNKARSGLANSNSLPFVSSMFAALRSDSLRRAEPASSKLKPAKQPLNSSPVRQVQISEPDSSTKNEFWDQHIPFSDDSDVEPGIIYSDSEHEGLDDGDEPEFGLVNAIECVLRLLQNGESPLFIIKKLIVFSCRFQPTQDSLLVKLVSAYKSLEKSESNTMQVLISCIEALYGKMENVEKPIHSTIVSVKSFLNSSVVSTPKTEAQDVVLDVIIDDALVSQLLSPTEEDLDITQEPLQLVTLHDLSPSYTTGGDTDWNCEFF